MPPSLRAPLLAAGLAFALAACPAPAGPTDAATDSPADASGIDALLDDADATTADVPADLLRPPMITRTQPESVLSARRQACGFAAGAWPAETLGVEYPVGADIPINHVVVIIQENRSFDHYLGRLVAQGYYQPGDFSRGADGSRGPGFSHADQLDGPPPGWSLPDGAGGTVVPHPDDAYCYGVNHSWDDMHADYDDGRMDGFVTNNNPGGHRAMFYEDDTVIPFYYALATTFAIGDQYHASVMTSTWPNRMFAMAATSFGIGDNSLVTSDTAITPANNIFRLLDAGGHSWKDYTDGPHQVLFFPYYGTRPRSLQRQRDVRCDLMTDIANGTLPDVAFVMGNEVTATADEGPSALPGIGGAWVEGIVRAIFASPVWRDTAVFITYDENGGLADHVPPEPACPPDGLPAHNERGAPLNGGFDRTGFRVPFIVVSPYARRHFVSHLVYDHTSLLRFIEARFGLPAMTARDANATPPMELFDFASPPFASPPEITAHTTVPQAILDRCNQHMEPLGCPDR